MRHTDPHPALAAYAQTLAAAVWIGAGMFLAMGAVLLAMLTNCGAC